MEHNNFLAGKWKVEGLYEHRKEKGRWEYIDAFRPGNMVWEFTGTSDLIMYRNGKETQKTTYFYNRRIRELVIDMSWIEACHVHNILYFEYYRVDIRSNDEVWLYELDDTFAGENDYGLALRLLKI